MPESKRHSYIIYDSKGFTPINGKLPHWNPGNPNLYWGFEEVAGIDGKRYLHYPEANFYVNGDGTVRAFGQDSIPIVNRRGKNYIEVMVPGADSTNTWWTGNKYHTVKNHYRFPVGDTIRYVEPPVLQPKPEQIEELQKTIEEAKPNTIKPNAKTTSIKQPVPSSVLETLSKSYINIIKPHKNEDPAYTPVAVWSVAADGHYYKIMKLKNGKFRLQNYQCDWADGDTVIVDENPIEDIISDTIPEYKYSFVYSPEYMWKSPNQPLEKTTLKSEQGLETAKRKPAANTIYRSAGLIGSGINRAQDYLKHEASYDLERLKEQTVDKLRDKLRQFL